MLLAAVYGGLNVLFGAFVLSGVIHPAWAVDRTALRWHVGVWDLRFSVSGILLTLGTAGYWRRTATGSKLTPLAAFWHDRGTFGVQQNRMICAPQSVLSAQLSRRQSRRSARPARS